MWHYPQIALRVEANGNAKKWQCALIEVVDASCTSAIPYGFLVNDYVTADQTVTRDYTYANQWSQFSLRMAGDSGPFNGALYVSAVDSEGKVFPCMHTHAHTQTSRHTPVSSRDLG